MTGSSRSRRSWNATTATSRTSSLRSSATRSTCCRLALCTAYQAVYRAHVGSDFPQNPYDQLRASIEAVFRSWNAPRAVRYREISGIVGLQGTAVNVQVMVFGNMGDDSGTGVAFTRDPSTGANQFYGEFLVNAASKCLCSTPIPC